MHLSDQSFSVAAVDVACTVSVAANFVEKGSMRIQSKEFLIVQHFGSGRDIPALTAPALTVGMSESASAASLASVMSDSIMMESILLQTQGLFIFIYLFIHQSTSEKTNKTTVWTK